MNTETNSMFGEIASAYQFFGYEFGQQSCDGQEEIDNHRKRKLFLLDDLDSWDSVYITREKFIKVFFLF